MSDDGVIFDVGANIGSLTFNFAQLVPKGLVFAFEPTDYAFKKLLRNLSLNPVIAKRIIPIQQFLSDHKETDPKKQLLISFRFLILFIGITIVLSLIFLFIHQHFLVIVK